ncbi:T9SS type A sorting domain-containing protein [Aquimarina sp. RZ0]|uniref:T9SS type A sorting domain-containing protein n=1 Tax=Aquimarina sp. RZ0 TaxID=2607730 RepID=UPI0011F25116|nr:T9SS type A sorting domain-containing protein [Aquimarina sp. RZ0]KAA1245586.1 T9SS type A sorting domain-containing protein [Aquimarina sp. RZ0]
MNLYEFFNHKSYDVNNTAILSNPEFNRAQFSVELYPNPATSIVHFQTRKTIGDTSVKIYDILGKDQIHAIMNGDQMDLNISELSSGVYFVTFQNKNATSTIKMIVE